MIASPLRVEGAETSLARTYPSPLLAAHEQMPAATGARPQMCNGRNRSASLGTLIVQITVFRVPWLPKPRFRERSPIALMRTATSPLTGTSRLESFGRACWRWQEHPLVKGTFRRLLLLHSLPQPFRRIQLQVALPASASPLTLRAHVKCEAHQQACAAASKA